MKKQLRKKHTRFLALLLVLALLLSFCGCNAKKNEDPEDNPIREGDAGTVFCLSPSLQLTPEDVQRLTGLLPQNLLFTSTTSVAVTCLLDGTGDSLFTLKPTAEFYAARSEYLSVRVSENAAALSMLVSVERPELQERLTSAIRKLKEDGTIQTLYDTWVTAYTEEGRPENAEEQPEISSFTLTSEGEPPETIRVGISGTLPLIDYMLDAGIPGGFTAAFFAALATELEVNIEFRSVLPESKVSALLDDKIDVYFWHFLDVPEVTLATEPFLDVPFAFLDADVPEQAPAK